MDSFKRIEMSFTQALPMTTKDEKMNQSADNRANRALGAVNAGVAALRGDSPMDLKVQMAKNTNMMNALIADAAMTTGEFSQPALFNCKRGPDGSIVSEAVVGSAGIEPAIFAM